jgi:drug/metabolite transporter, DME family
MSRSSWIGIALVLCAASFWGVGGLFIRMLIDEGVTPVQVAFYANGLSSLVLFAGLAVLAPRYLRVSLSSLPTLLPVGVFGSGLAGLFYVSAVAESTLSLATVLLYTSPAWVTLLAWRFLGEPIGTRKAVAVGLAVIGVAFAAQAYDPAALSGSVKGILYGIAGGFCYGVFVILSKRALRRHHPLTVTAYANPSAALLLLPLQSSFPPLAPPTGALPWLGLYVMGSQVFGAVAYNTGLRRTPAGLVSVLALWSPITTLALSAILLGEELAPLQIVGALLVIGSVILMRPGASSADTTVTEPAPSSAALRAG